MVKNGIVNVEYELLVFVEGEYIHVGWITETVTINNWEPVLHTLHHKLKDGSKTFGDTFLIRRKLHEFIEKRYMGFIYKLAPVYPACPHCGSAPRFLKGNRGSVIICECGLSTPRVESPFAYWTMLVELINMGTGKGVENSQ